MPMNPFFNDPMFRKFFNVPQGQQEQKRQGLGSGFIISEEGFIVTNNHVVQNVDKITVKLQNNQTYSAKLIGSDSVADLALLKIDGGKNLRSVHLGDSDDVGVGDFAIAIGNPFGLQSTFTFGVISSTGQDIDTADGVPRIQTDAAINPGNSGGPLLNIKGQVIGINQMIYSQSGGSVGIGFAIPVNYAKVVVENLKKGKKITPGYIGVSIAQTLDENQQKELGILGKKGLLVAQVEIGSPAWKAGIRPYDLLTHVDGVVLEKFSLLKAAIMRKGAGNFIEITFLRDQKDQKVKVKIGEAPEQQQ
jgi:serine protease Do